MCKFLNSRTSTGSSTQLEKVGFQSPEKLPRPLVMQNRLKSRVGDYQKIEKQTLKSRYENPENLYAPTAAQVNVDLGENPTLKTL